MDRRTIWLAVSVIPALAFGGCALFAPRPVVPERPSHVIIVGIDGLKPADVPQTLHVARMADDGAYTWDMQARTPQDRIGTYCEALTGLPQSLHVSKASMAQKSIFARCRAAGLGAMSVVRTGALAAFDPQAVLVSQVSKDLDTAEATGSYAAAQFLAKRPACLFVELSDGRDKLADSDAGLGKLFAAIARAGVADRTTVILISPRSDHAAWMVRGPDTRHHDELAGVVSAADTFATVARLLGVPVQNTLGKAVTDAFRRWSRQPPSKGERIVPRGSIRGTVMTVAGEPMAKASVLLVSDEPADGIRERWADTDAAGEFRFDSIPADRYDYVFVFDNLPARLRRSLLVARNVDVQRDGTADLKLWYRRLRGTDATAAPVGPAKSAAAFLDDEQLKTLRRAACAALPVWSPAPDEVDPPALVADALTGRRAQTTLVREWLLAATEKLGAALKSGAADAKAIEQMIDLAVAYDINRAAGLLTDTEERELRAALAIGAEFVLRAHRPGLVPKNPDAELALALVGGALAPSKLSANWLKAADKMFVARFKAVSADAEQDPAGLAPSTLCSILEYAMVNRALGCGNYADDELERVVDLASACLTPADRRVHPASSAATPRGELGYLGLAQSLFAGAEFGGRMRTLWTMCGSPYWAPRGDESVLGTLLTAAASARPQPLGSPASRQLTQTTAVLTRDWGMPSEWFIVINGWTADVHVDAARLAAVTTGAEKGRLASAPHVLRFRSAPAYDYALLGGWVSPPGTAERVSAFRHVLLNKLTGYLVISDEFPPGFVTATQAQAAGSARAGVLVGKEGYQAQVLALSAAASGSGSTASFTSASSRPALVVYGPPPGVKPGAAKIEPWDVTIASLAEDVSATGFTGTHFVLTADRGPEFVRLARAAAHVSGNNEDTLMEGRVGLIRRGETSSDLMLVDAKWAQSDSLFFGLSGGDGYVTVEKTGGAEGSSNGPRRTVSLSLGRNASKSPTLTVDGRRWTVRMTDRAEFSLPRGPHGFRIK